MSEENVAQRSLALIEARSLLANVSTPAFLANHQGALVFYNEAAEALLGITFQQAGKMDPEEWGARFGPFDSAGERMPSEEAPLMIALRESRPVHASLFIHSADGEVHQIEVSAFPLTTKQAPTGVIGFFWPAEEPPSSARPER